MILGHKRGQLEYFDVETMQSLHITVVQNQTPFTCMSIHPDGELLAFGTN
jgi:hypothetical protein